MKFFKVEWTKKKSAIALLATALAVSSFVLGGYVATGTTTAATSGDCGVAGGTGGQNGAELTTNGFAAAAGAVTDISGNSPQSSTVVKTFTDATAATTVAQSCLVNQAANASANRV